MKIITGCKIITPRGILENKSLIFDGRIVAVEDSGSAEQSGAQVISAEGGYVLPGFVDIHVHGGGGYDFLDSAPEAIDTVLKTHARHGTTSLLATTLTCPDEILCRGIKMLGEAMKNGTEGGSELLGLHLEGPYFSSAAKGAQAITEQKLPNISELENWRKLSNNSIVRIDAAPELPDMDILARWVKDNGVLASIGHSGANAETAIEYLGKGFTHITHLYCSTTTEHKEGQVVHGGIVEAAYLCDDFTVELIADGKHIPKETMLLCFKIKGADKTALITDAMRAAGTDAERSVLGEIKTGTPVIIEDGVAKLADRSSFAGSVATMDVCFHTALSYGVPLCDAVKSCSLTPARIIGVDDRKGSLEPGKDADILIYDRDFNLKKVFVRGNEIV